ncbi:MAG: M64 family metallopeptidase [Verrucomicrobiae bacterium]
MNYFWHRVFRRFLLLAFIGLGLTSARSAIFSTIVTNGPTTNRVNLVFLSEGYTSGQVANFLNDATNAANAFLTAEPYAEYASYFNVFAIFTNSANAGSTHLNSYTYHLNNTCFNSTYDGNIDRIITIPPNPSDSTNSHGQGRIDALLQQYLPNTNNNFAVLLVNDVIEGGSDTYGKVAITALGNLSHFLVHESGHAIGGLGDEYTDAYPGYSTNDVEPNTTTQTNYTQIKWKAWISTNTPIPTPAFDPYLQTVGLFEGAHYYPTGWFRPFYDCRMNHRDLDYFCPVCQEALVLAIYGKVRPLAARFPTNNSLTVTSATNLTFSLNLLQPATHNLNIQWRTNNVAMAGATNPVLSISPMQLGGGTKKVEAVIWDATDMVRTDLKNVLKQTNTWTLNVTLPVLVINSLKWLNNSNFTLQVTGTVPDPVSIQMSTNLAQWVAVHTNVFSNGKFSYTNVGASQFPQRYFRALTPP